jgi:hypothetical protein
MDPGERYPTAFIESIMIGPFNTTRAHTSCQSWDCVVVRRAFEVRDPLPESFHHWFHFGLGKSRRDVLRTIPA